MFIRFRTTILITLLAGLPAAAQAQNSPAVAPPCDSACTAHAGGMRGMGNMGNMNMSMNMDPAMCMRMMTAGDARLDSLVTAMHSATGGAGIGAMERVIDELLVQRKTMHEHMMHMMMNMHAMLDSGPKE